MNEQALERPRRIQRKRTKGWRKPAGVVDCTRHCSRSADMSRYGNYTPEGTAEAYEAWLARMDPAQRARFLAPLRGKSGMCWCPEGAACHADVLLRWANSPAEDGTNA